MTTTLLPPISFEKTPNEILYWSLSFALRFTSPGEVFSGTPTSRVALDPSSPVSPGTPFPVIDQITTLGPVATFRVSGGIDGAIYRLDLLGSTTDLAGAARTREGDAKIYVND